MWWTDEKIGFYDRAASASDFHRRLADLLEPYLGQAASIAELGCGLGFMTAQLTDRGHAVTGYDSDQRAISWAARRFPFSAFRCRDCYSLGLVADTSIAVFFGRLTSDDNCERLLETCSRRLIYVDNEHEEYEGCSWKHFQKTEDFLRQKGLRHSFQKCHLRFDQILSSRTELEDYIRVNYTERSREFSRPVVEEGGLIRVINDKAFSIFAIDKEDKKSTTPP